jgi:MFS family permease
VSFSLLFGLGAPSVSQRVEARPCETDWVHTYRELFGVAEFRGLFIAQCLTVAASSVSNLALGTITYAGTGSALLTSLALFGGPLIRLVASWFLVSLSDLLRPRTALLLVAVVSAATSGLQAIPTLPWWARVILLAIPWLVMAATGGSMLGLVSDILPGGSYVFGRATLNIAVGVMQIAGYGFGGVLLLALSTSGLFVVAACASAVGAVVVLIAVRDHPPRATTPNLFLRSHRVNSELVGSRVIRPVLFALWIPNGLIVGCESLFIPYAGASAGLLFAAAAAGMLVGDVSVGRFIPVSVRLRLVEPLRILLAAPYLLFLLHPPLAAALAIGFVASIGYAASLPLQERLITHTADDIRGQVLGLNVTGLLGMQGIGAALAGTLAQLLHLRGPAVGLAIGIMAILSLAVTFALIPGLRRSKPEPVVAEKHPGSVPEA